MRAGPIVVRSDVCRKLFESGCVKSASNVSPKSRTKAVSFDVRPATCRRLFANERMQATEIVFVQKSCCSIASVTRPILRASNCKENETQHEHCIDKLCDNLKTSNCELNFYYYTNYIYNLISTIFVLILNECPPTIQFNHSIHFPHNLHP